MKIQCIPTLFVLFCLATTCYPDTNYAGPIAKPDEVMLNNSQMKVKNGFGAQFWITDNEAFYLNWMKEDVRNLNSVVLTKRNQPLFLVLFVSNPGELVQPPAKLGGASSRTCDVTYDFDVLKPDGKSYGSGKGISGLKGEAPAPGLVHLVNGRITINFEAIDPPGIYTIGINVHDNVKMVSIELERKIMLQE